MSQIADFDAQTPFVSQGNYSSEAIALMRVLRDLRGESGSVESSPAQVLAALRSLGYRRQSSAFMNDDAEVHLFSVAMQRFAKKNNAPYPTCDDVIAVVRELGYERAIDDSAPSDSGLPIDRRRKEFDTRLDISERRSSTDLSPQEQLDLTDEEHSFLDALKELRERTGRGFASSEELLSIAWRLGYRPVVDSQPMDWIDDTERVRLQVQFSTAIESRVRTVEGFLTCRDVLSVVREVGFERVS